MHLHSRVHSPLLAHYNILIYSFEELIIRKLPVVSTVYEYSIFVREGRGGKDGMGAVGLRQCWGVLGVGECEGSEYGWVWHEVFTAAKHSNSVIR